MLVLALSFSLSVTFNSANPAAPAAGGSPRQVLPASMTGTWGWSARSCRTAGDDGRVTVRARSIAFFAAAYTLETIVARADGTIRAQAIVQEEGESGVTRSEIALKLVRRDRLAITTEAAGNHTYVRCR
jgi:hypothetical protein